MDVKMMFKMISTTPTMPTLVCYAYLLDISREGTYNSADKATTNCVENGAGVQRDMLPG